MQVVCDPLPAIVVQGQSRKDNPQTLAKSGHTRHRTKTNKTQHRKLKRWATRAPPKPGVNPDAREE